jgi:hypothetical protein
MTLYTCKIFGMEDLVKFWLVEQGIWFYAKQNALCGGLAAFGYENIEFETYIYATLRDVGIMQKHRKVPWMKIYITI